MSLFLTTSYNYRENLMNKRKPLSGVLMGIVADEAGTPFIGLDINGAKLAMSVPHAALVFDQLGDLLDTLGYFDDMEETVECPKKEGKTTCH